MNQHIFTIDVSLQLQSWIQLIGIHNNIYINMTKCKAVALEDNNNTTNNAYVDLTKLLDLDVVDKEVLAAIIDYVKKWRSQTVSIAEQLDILLLYAAICTERHKKRRKMERNITCIRKAQSRWLPGFCTDQGLLCKKSGTTSAMVLNQQRQKLLLTIVVNQLKFLEQKMLLVKQWNLLDKGTRHEHVP